MAADGATVEVEALTAGYRLGLGRRVVVEDLSFRLLPGSVTGLVGLNGVGKTTLIRILLGFLAPWQGRALVSGRPPRRYRRRHGIGYLPEALHLPGGLSTGTLLELGARLAGAREAAVAATVDALLALVGLDELRGQTLARLSRGQARLAGLAFALAGWPGLLVLDEPENGLDPRSRRALRGAVAEARRRGCTILLSSHDLAELERMADTILVLEGGRLARRLTPGAEDLESLLLGDEPPRPGRKGAAP